MSLFETCITNRIYLNFRLESSVGNVVGQLLQKDGSSILTASLALERKRSVQLLDEVIRNEALALSLEAAIAQQLQYDLKEPSQQYFEAITRCFTSLKVGLLNLLIRFN